MLIEIYADGSGNSFDSDGGFGWCIVVDGEFHSEGNGYIPSATNNVAELSAAIHGLRAAKNKLCLNSSGGDEQKFVLVSDSQLCLGYASGRYRCKAEHLRPLAVELQGLYKELNADVRWVKGHSGNQWNEHCDKLAKTAREGKGQ